jgi:hypothetical protein
VRTESSPAATLEYQFLVPFEAAVRRLRNVDTFSLNLRRARGDVLSLLPFPQLLGQASARPTRSRDFQAPDVQQVLGEQAAIQVEGGGGGGLTFGRLPLWGLALALVSSLLLVAALVPPAVIAHTPLSPTRFARIRQPLALTATAILILALAGLVAALS